MKKLALLVPLAVLPLAGCPTPPPEEPLLEEPMRVDTLVVTREVAAPLPEGRMASICVANGQDIPIRISSAGDTLVGPRRVRLADLGPGVGFLGDYAGNAPWFVNDQAIRFGQRQYSKFGQATARECDTMKIVGEHMGVNLFAETTASAPFSQLYVPVRPGVFQPYQTQVGRVRG